MTAADRKDAGARVAEGLLGIYQTSGFFVLRTPLLPVANFAEWNARAANGEWDADRRDRLRRSLSRLLAAPVTADSLRVASPALADQCDGWFDREPSRRKERMERTLVQYFARMCDRCTPFGLFAGVSVGEVGGETRLWLASRERYGRRSALDLAQVAKLAQSLLRDDLIRRNLRYRLNDTVAAVPGGYQYVETKQLSGETRHEMAFLETDEALSAAIDGGSGTAKPLSEYHDVLAAAITDPEVGPEDIDEYLDDLIEAQILQPELIPAVVGDDPLDQMSASLEAVTALTAPAARVRRLRGALDALDAHGVGAPPSAYAAVNTAWTDTLGQAKTDRLLQVDMFKEAADLRLSEEVVEEALRGAETLWRLVGPVPDELRDLKNRFRERYEAREVPLAEAFDPERGLGSPGPDLRPQGPGAPLLAGLDLGAGRGRDGGSSDALANRILALHRASTETLDLDDELLERLAPRERSELPTAIGLHLDLLADSEAAVRRGDFRLFFHGCVGPSGARMLGRFCDLDPTLLEAVRRHLRDEEALEPDIIFAEVVHSPEGRLGNVVRRPHVREVELSWAGDSRRPGPQRLTVDDLLIRLEGSRFRLRSRRDGREVRPRLTSAHNFRRGSGMYRLLCGLQNDGTRPGFGWSWGTLNRLPFLPRVTRGRAVYAFARWKVGKERPDYKAVGKARTATAREEAMTVLISTLGLPRFVRLREGDNRLLLDLDNPLCLSVLADHAAHRPALILEETLAEDLKGCVSGPEGKYRNEIILPLVRREPVPRDARREGATRRIKTSSSVPRVFPPGATWRYFKFYTPSGVADRLLAEVVAPLASLHQEFALGEPWFFIRYSDPEPHLRVRFRGGRQVLSTLDDRAATLSGPFLEDGSIQRVSLDTYVREIERYGGSRGIELAEGWFQHDSAAVLRLVEHVRNTEDESLRWKAVAMGFDRLLTDFGLDHEGRRRVVAGARESFGREFGAGPATRRRLATRLRAERADLEALLAGDVGDDARFAELDRVFRERSARTTGIVREYRRLEETGSLECPLDEVLRSFTHMHANRMLPASAGAQELVIHDFLTRTYRSLMARRGK